MADPGALLSELLREADARALPALYDLVSVDVVAVRRDLRRRGLPFVDPEAPPARLVDVDRTADAVIARARSTSALVAVVGGLGGWVGAPSEVAAWGVAVVRLAQRLAVVYGLDPASPRGRAAISRALAAGFGASVPEGGPTGLRVSALARLGDGAPREVGAKVARAIVRRSATLAAGRLGRLVPVLSSGVGALENHRVALEIGGRMKAVLRQLGDAEEPAQAIVEAVEVTPGSSR